MFPAPPPHFARTGEDGIVLWRGQPDCEAAHRCIIEWLTASTTRLLTDLAEADNVLKGNLGEFISFHVGRAYAFPQSDFRAYPANAWAPLAAISKPDIDVVWLHFAARPADDAVLLQAVKTTGDTSLRIEELEIQHQPECSRGDAHAADLGLVQPCRQRESERPGDTGSGPATRAGDSIVSASPSAAGVTTNPPPAKVGTGSPSAILSAFGATNTPPRSTVGA